MKQHNPTAATMTEDVEIAPGVAELHHELCKEEVDAIWDSYDRDGTGSLDKKELRALLEDLSQLKKGHRNVREAIVDEVRPCAETCFFPHGMTKRGDGHLTCICSRAGSA